MTFLTVSSYNPVNAVEFTLPTGTPHSINHYAAKVTLDILLHKYMYGTDVDNAISLLPTKCLRHVTNGDIWQLLTYWRPVNYHRIKYKIAARMYREEDCYLDKIYWRYWEPYLLDISY
jgi:hypothetical protein